MDHVSSLECLKLDSQSEVLDKDGGGKDLLSPDTIPLNCDTPIIDNKAEERKAAKQCLEKPSDYFKLHWTPPPNSIFVIKADEPKADEAKDKSSIGECLYCLKVGDHISHFCPYKSLECPKLDSQSEVLDKDRTGKDLLSPDTAPLNYNTPIIDSKAEEPMNAKQFFEDLSTYFKLHWTPPPNSIFDIKADDPKAHEPKDKSSIGECLYCLKVGDHISHFCPYKSDVPKNAIVGSGCVVNCKVCGCRFRGSCCANCGISLGRAILMNCSACGKVGEHMSYECPSHPSVGFNCDPYTGAFSFGYAPLKE